MQWITVPSLERDAIGIMEDEFDLVQSGDVFRVLVNLYAGAYRVHSHRRSINIHGDAVIKSTKMIAFNTLPSLFHDPEHRGSLLGNLPPYFGYVAKQSATQYPNDKAKIEYILYSYPLEAIVADSFFRLR